MKKPKNKLPKNNSTDKECQFCAGKKLVYCLPNGGIEVNKAYKEVVEQMLNKLGEKLEKKSCPHCVGKNHILAKAGEKIKVGSLVQIKKGKIYNVKSTGAGKKPAKKNHS